MKRVVEIIRSLKFRMLLPVIFVVVALVIILTWYTSKTYTSTILEREDAKVQSAFTVTGNAVKKITESTQQTAVGTLTNSAIQLYALNSFRSSEEMIIARMNCNTLVDTILQQQPYLHGILYMRENGSLFGRLRDKTYYNNYTAQRIFSNEIVDSIRQSYRKVLWIGPIQYQELYELKTTSHGSTGAYMLGVHRMTSM